MVISKQKINRCAVILFFLIVNSSFNKTFAQGGLDLPMIEDFERDSTWVWMPWKNISNGNSLKVKGSAHSGKFGLLCGFNGGYYTRDDVQIGEPGQVISCWIRFQSTTNAYLGFGRNLKVTENGYHLVLAPEKNSFDLRKSADYTYPNLKSATQTYKMNTWYRLELIFNTSTNVTGKLYLSNGTTLINTINVEIPDLTPGGISFRGHHLHVDDIQGGSKQAVTDTFFAPIMGQPLILKNIVFDLNKSNLLEQSYVELDKLVKYLKRNPTFKINIIGHTDNIGSEIDKKNLSEARAKSVADYLVSHGINNKNIHHLGLGSLKPIATNDTEEERQKNRRVEFTISSN